MTVATSANMANTARSETEFVAKALLFCILLSMLLRTVLPVCMRAGNEGIVMRGYKTLLSRMKGNRFPRLRKIIRQVSRPSPLPRVPLWICSLAPAVPSRAQVAVRCPPRPLPRLPRSGLPCSRTTCRRLRSLLLPMRRLPPRPTRTRYVLLPLSAACPVSLHMRRALTETNDPTRRQPVVTFEAVHALRRITLNRPKALNSLNDEMVDLIQPQLEVR